MFNLIADYDGGAGAAGGGIMVMLWILGVVYGIICFFVPICIYSMSGRVKEINRTLKSIEALLLRELKIEPPAQQPKSGIGQFLKGVAQQHD